MLLASDMATHGHHRQLWTVILGLGGGALSLLYITGPAVPLALTVPLLTVIAGWVVANSVLPSSPVSFLPRVSMLMYIMPFLHLWGYLIWDDFVFLPSAILSLGYQLDRHIVSQLGLIGLIGAIGLTCGLLLANVGHTGPRPAPHPAFARSLGMLPFVLIVLVSLLFSWLDAPIQTILTEQYVEVASDTRFAEISFAGGALFAYVLMVILAIDMMKEPRRGLRLAKLWLIGLAFAVTLVWFQLLRGNRDILGLILGLLSLSLYAVTPQFSHWALARSYSRGNPAWAIRKRLMILVVSLALTYVSFQVLGQWRSNAALGESLGQDTQEVLRDSRRLSTGTWTAALLTPLSTVGDLELGFMRLRYGRTYMDIFLSLPPGPVARAIGYVRPFDVQETNLAWQMTYGAGGTHAVVSPLLNFSAPGVLVILALVGYLMGRVEKSVSSGSDRNLFFQTTLIVGSAHFFWYGEIYWIRGVMAAVAIWWVYQALLRFELLSPGGAHRFPMTSGARPIASR
jgi:hypothetical protein